MNKEHDDFLFQNFPDIFRDRSNRSTILGQRGFECGDGWFGLVVQLAVALSQTGSDVRVQQIKEKFGKLRTYVSGPDEARQICQEYEALSATICEECSESPAFISALDGCYRTRCASCYAVLRKKLGPHPYDFADKNEIKRALVNHSLPVLGAFVQLYGIDAVQSAWEEIEPDQTAESIQQVGAILGTIRQRDKG